jgi:hypothetical protein
LIERLLPFIDSKSYGHNGSDGNHPNRIEQRPAKTAVAIVRKDRADLNGERIAAAADSHRSNQQSKEKK